jgi:hypothetical protein
MAVTAGANKRAKSDTKRNAGEIFAGVFVSATRERKEEGGTGGWT